MELENILSGVIQTQKDKIHILLLVDPTSVFGGDQNTFSPDAHVHICAYYYI